MAKKYIGDKNFYRQMLVVALPMMLQNFVTNFAGMLDNLMVGSVGTEEMSAVSIDNQLVFIFNLALFGILGGSGIFTAQFYGKENTEGIRYTFRYKMISAIGLLAVAIGIFITLDTPLINLFLHEGETEGNLESTLIFARQYIRIILIGLLPFAISQVYSSTLRETGETFAPMVVGFIAVFSNCVLNYVLIFGKFGAPALGVKGAAIATVISRYVEGICIVVYAHCKKKRFTYLNGAYKGLYIPKELVGKITVKAMPLLFNEFLWSSGVSLLSMGYSMHGINVLAGVSITSAVINLFNIAFLSLGASIGIIVGKLLGAEKYEEAIDTNRKMIVFCVGVSIVVGAIAIATGGAIPQLYKTNDASKMYATYFIRVCGILLPAVSISNASYFTLRSGGKTWVTIIFDSVFGMCVSVPTVFILYKVGLNIWMIYPIVQSLEIIKATLGLILVRKRVWVNNIVN